ncbi:MAG: hypothetical protein Q8K79_01185 [Solirubrobacteraceae bacterium]|nr:hypothetical protein [Solirubrobacteraceae bacterium]
MHDVIARRDRRVRSSRNAAVAAFATNDERKQRGHRDSASNQERDVAPAPYLCARAGWARLSGKRVGKLPRERVGCAQSLHQVSHVRLA